jgi:hypothetical protein
MARLVYTALADEDADGEEFEVTVGGPLYIRLWRDHDQYCVGVTYSPWPAYAIDPVRFGTWHTSLANALEGVHRVYRRYRQENVRPMPVWDVYDAYEIDTEALFVLGGLFS